MTTAPTAAVVERVARAIIVRKFGPAGVLLFDPPPEATKEERHACNMRSIEALEDARAALAASAHADLLRIAERVAEHFADTDAPLGIDARAAIAKATGATP